MRLSLLRAPTMPDAQADMHTHEIAWAIYPHLGTYTESDVAQVAYAFNTPFKCEYCVQLTVLCEVDTANSSIVRAQDQSIETTFKTIECPFKVEGAPNIVLETIKRGEDDSFSKSEGGTVILRLFEQYGGHARATLKM
jgi:alpha-mannosidase